MERNRFMRVAYKKGATHSETKKKNENLIAKAYQRKIVDKALKSVDPEVRDVVKEMMYKKYQLL